MARGEIFLPLNVNYAEDSALRKLSRFGNGARACRDLFVMMAVYCKRNQSDGHVPTDEIGVLAYPDGQRIGERDAGRLVEVGAIERTETGYYMPGYLKRNDSRADIEAKSAAKAKAGRTGGVRSGEARREASAKHSASNSGSTVLPEIEADSLNKESESYTESETESHLKSQNLPPADAVDATVTPIKRGPTLAAIALSFAEFWSVYPLKKGKGDAERVYAACLRRGVTPAEILAGAVAYRDDPKRREAGDALTKHPGGWLRDTRWLDEVTKPAPAATFAPWER
jgi:hypothetical protein